jgi:transcriptional/translational regulatory protein YebC/TACO1
MTKVLEDKGINVKSAELQRFPNITKEVTAEEEAALTKILDKFDEDDDVQNVFTTMA